MSLKNVAAKAVTVLRKEPVAVWGVVLAFVLGALPLLGVPAAVVQALSVALPLLGVPVVRRKVTARDAVTAVVVGAVKEATQHVKPAQESSK